MTRLSCKTCRWFLNNGGEDMPEWGECRRRAPAPVLLVNEDAADARLAIWPTVGFEGWCGEHDTAIDRLTAGARCPNCGDTRMVEHRLDPPPACRCAACGWQGPNIYELFRA